MDLSVRPKVRLLFSRLGSVSICLFSFAFLMLPQLSLPTWTASTEAEHPHKEEAEEKELVVRSSARRGNKAAMRRNALTRTRETGARLRQIASSGNRIPAIVGHEFANGLCAPLLT